MTAPEAMPCTEAADDPDPEPESPGSGYEIDVLSHGTAWADWTAAFEIVENTARYALEQAVAGSRLGLEEAELCILLTDDTEQRALNRTYRGKNKPTNVLSFPQADPAEIGTESGLAQPGGHLGDITVARETLKREAAARDIPETDHLRHLIVHGVLHLLGWDHATESDASAMEALETRILGDLGIADPYAEAAGAAR